MDRLLTVRLAEHAGTGLIVEWKSGVVYVCQAGGTACLQLRREGILVPLGNSFGEAARPESLASPLSDYFEGPPWQGTGAPSGLTAADADVIDAVLAKNPSFKGIAVDRSRLAESREAWVLVTIDPVAASAVGALGGILENVEPLPRSAVLVWPSSD